MKVLVAFEFSGRVRDAFLARKYDAWSCDLLPTESPGPHLQCDVRDVLDKGWDLMIAHPPCTYLCNSGARWLYEEQGRFDKVKEAAELFNLVLDAPIKKIAVENPIMHVYAKKLVKRSPDQIVRPWQFGNPETKSICLWLKNLYPLVPTEISKERVSKCHREGASQDRWKKRSRTFPEVAEAMVDQWGIW